MEAIKKDIVFIIQDYRDDGEAKGKFAIFRGYELSEICPLPIPSPKLEYDKGKFIYGFQCWWISFEKINEVYKEFKKINLENYLNLSKKMEKSYHRSSEYIKKLIVGEIVDLINI